MKPLQKLTVVATSPCSSSVWIRRPMSGYNIDNNNKRYLDCIWSDLYPVYTGGCDCCLLVLHLLSSPSLQISLVNHYSTQYDCVPRTIFPLTITVAMSITLTITICQFHHLINKQIKYQILGRGESWKPLLQEFSRTRNVAWRCRK